MRVAVIGLGNAGYTLHLPALAAMSGVDVVGCVDTDHERCERARLKFNKPVFATTTELYQRAQPDVVCIATPPSTHADLCLEAFSHGAHVMCEKPFVSSLMQADAVIAASNFAGKGLALNHEFREMPVFKAVRDVISNGSTGGLNFAQVWQLMDLPPWSEPGWRGQMLQRTLFEAGVHLVDLLLSLFNERPAAVQAWTSTCGVREGDTDAVALVTMEFSRGRLATVTQNRLCKGDTQYVEVRADTAHASLRASFGGRARVSAGLLRSKRPHVRVEYGTSGVAWQEIGASRKQLARNGKEPGMIATRGIFDKSFDAFRRGTKPPVSGAVARDVLAVIAASYHSANTGARVAINDETLAQLRDMHLG